MEVSRVFARDDDPEGLQRIVDAGFRIAPNVCALSGVNVLTWCASNGTLDRSDPAVCEKAAQDGRIETLRRAVALGCVVSPKVCGHLAAEGELDAIAWLDGTGCPHDAVEMYYRASANGQLHVLRWLWERGHPCPDFVVLAAADGRHTHVLDWVLEIGAPLKCVNEKNVRPASKCQKTLEPLDAVSLFPRDVVQGDCALMRWAHDRMGWTPRGNDYETPIRAGDIKAVRWLLSLGVPDDPLDCVKLASEIELPLMRKVVKAVRRHMESSSRCAVRASTELDAALLKALRE